jgi:aspartate aminotransferase
MDAGMSVEYFQYWDPKNLGVDFEAVCDAIKTAPSKSIFILHACAHNPTGNDPTPEQWKILGELIKEKNHLAVFDSAYQGFASGDLDRDGQSVRIFVDLGLELLIAQSYAKNFGLYNERCGCLVVVTKSTDEAVRVRSNLCAIQRAMISNPPAFGARIVTKVLNNAELFAEWKENLLTMVNRIQEMRQALYYQLTSVHKTPGNWDHIISQIGMFSYTGLSKTQSVAMRDKFHCYMTENGRISIAGLTKANVIYFAESMDWVVRNVQFGNKL